MKTLHINDEVYEKLKAFVDDPFDDTPNAVLQRLIDIANKAQDRWCAFSPAQPADGPSPLAGESPSPLVGESPSPNRSVPSGTRIPDTADEGTALML